MKKSGTPVTISPKILIVEDESLIAMVLEELLKHSGYDVTGIAVTGEEAVAMAEKDVPDLIIMDYGLPGNLNGIEASQQIRKRRKIPVILMTGYMDKAFEEMAEKNNLKAYLVKPVQFESLIKTIKSVLDQSHS